jgi:hypothetical protein
MCADAFIIPTNPDPFSVMAIRTLKTMLPRWKKWSLMSRQYFESATYPLPDTGMKFLGEIIQRFNIRAGRAAHPYQAQIEQIKSCVETELVPELNKNNMVYKPDTDHCLAEIKDFGALSQKANDNHIPVVALTDNQVGYSGNVGDNVGETKEDIQSKFDSIASMILESVL